MKVGDYVVRKKYHKDIIFVIERIEGEIAYLKGVEIRLLADSPLDDLEISTQIYREEKLDRELFCRPGILKGKVLHLDGDVRYLEMCLAKYENLGLRVDGYHYKEADMPQVVIELLRKHRPDILVITGHDARHKDETYAHSADFVQTVRQARTFEKDKDRLIIFAGACQSNYEALIAAGANFASSPGRINIHALDPVYISSQIASESVKNYIDIERILDNTSCKTKGIGGIDTRGVARKVYPNRD